MKCFRLFPFFKILYEISNMTRLTRRFRPFQSKQIARRISLIYLAAAGLLLLLFKQFQEALGEQDIVLPRLENYQAMLFIALTGGLIYAVTRRYVAQFDRGEKGLREVVQSVSAAVGQAFFQTLVEQLSKSLQADYAFIGERTAENPNRIQVIAAFAHGRSIPNFEYDLSGTPCVNVLAGKPCCYEKNARLLFPKDQLLARMKVDSYIGTPLFDSTGQAIGLMVVMDERPVQDQLEAESLLQIFALRAAAELERLRNEKAIRRLAFYDPLTGLPNQQLFKQHLTQSLEQAEEADSQLAVIFLDLDRFKTIVRTLGHTLGEQLLVAIAQRLTRCLRPSDLLARLGDDEFTLLMPRMSTPEEIASMAAELLGCLKAPFTFVEHELHITASIGIAIYPHDGADAETLLKNADAAMSRTKEMGRNNFQFYYPELNQMSLQALIMENKLHQALDREEFQLRYQPQLHLQSGQIVGMEALVCWKHPDRTMVSPADFIPLAENTGLIQPIGEWVLRTACEQNILWQKAGLPPQKVAVNVSARQFYQQDIVALVARVLEETGLEPRWLALELTESVIMQDVETTKCTLHRLKEMGVQITIDDFGTGYSSLSYLKQFPIETLKIDKSFVDDLPRDSEDKGITAAIIAMAHTLGMDVVAEGVEREEQCSYLKSIHCDKIQGYLFSPPLKADDLGQLLTHQLERACSG